MYIAHEIVNIIASYQVNYYNFGIYLLDYGQIQRISEEMYPVLLETYHMTQCSIIPKEYIL